MVKQVTSLISDYFSFYFQNKQFRKAPGRSICPFSTNLFSKIDSPRYFNFLIILFFIVFQGSIFFKVFTRLKKHQDLSPNLYSFKEPMNRFQESIPPAYVAWNRFPGSLNVYQFELWTNKGNFCGFRKGKESKGLP